tara:strand:+ start:2235 stop:2828 length:594 start_codon:yes stop_codon:yes gene_type:complete
MPLPSSIDGFLGKIKQGVKPNMFEVEIQFPDNYQVANDDIKLTNLLCKSTNLPGSNLGVIEVPFRGRTVKIAGDRTFDNWSATFFNDKDFKVRSFFEEWSQFINTHEGNTAPRFIPEFGEAGYMATIKVHQLEKNATDAGGSIIRSYELVHAFPTSVSSIDLAYDSNDQIEEFTVEFQMSYWKTTGGTPAGAAALGS